MAATEVTLRTDLGEVDVRLVADRSRHTVGDLATAVLGRRAPDVVDVDGRPRAAGTLLDEAGVRRGSTVDVSSSATLTPAAEPAVHADLDEVAGFGAGAVASLGEGLHLLGTTRRVNAPHLASGTVDEPIVLVEIEAGRLRVAPAGDRPVWVDGRRIHGATRWDTGVLVAGDRVLRRRPPGQTGTGDGGAQLDGADPSVPSTGSSTDGERTVVELGRRLDDDGRAGRLHVDARAGIGIVGEPGDTLAMLRSLTLDLATRPDLVERIVVRTDRPRSWEWAKWLPQVTAASIVRADGLASLEAGLDDGADGAHVDPGRLLVIVDRTSPDALPAALPSDAIVLGGASSSHQLPVLLGSIVEPIAGGAAAVRITTTVDGAPISYGRVAPHACSDRDATERAKSLAMAYGHRPADDADPDGQSSGVRADGEVETDLDGLRLEAWTLTRHPSPLERRILRHASSTPWTRPDDHDETEGTDDDWVEPDLRTPLDAIYGRALVDGSRIVLPLGWWTERDGLATIQLVQGRHLLLTGKAKVGRSTLLSLMVEGARRAGPHLDLFALAPRRGPLLAADRRARLDLDVAANPDEVKGWIERIQASVRPIVFVDDADRVGGPSLDRLGGEDFDHATVVIAARPGLSANHWSAPWHSSLLTIQLDAPGEGALVTRHRSRAFRTISPDERDE